MNINALKIVRAIFTFGIFKKLKKQILLITLLHLLILMINLFFSYWHYKFSYNVFLAKDTNGIMLYFFIYAIVAILEIIFKSEIFAKTANIVIEARILLYEKIEAKFTDLEAGELNCQRISQDMTELFEMIMNIFLPFIFIVLSVPFYVIIVLLNTNLLILLISLLYCLISALFIISLDNHLVSIESELEQAEGEFRRELTLSFAGYRHEMPKLDLVKYKTINLIRSKKVLKVRNGIILKLASFLKYLLPMSFYLSGQITFPGLGQMAKALGELFESSNFILGKKEELMKFEAVCCRLKPVLLSAASNKNNLND